MPQVVPLSVEMARGGGKRRRHSEVAIDHAPKCTARFRTAHGLLDHASWSWRNNLEADCRKVFLQKSFWLGSNVLPRCALEEMAHKIFLHHTRNIPPGSFDPCNSGTEWWVHFRGPAEQFGEGMGFHWDKDEFLADRSDGPPFQHPCISTVTYLSDQGAPTLVLTHEVPNAPTIAGRREVRTAFLSHPIDGKHVSFDGRLLHGVPSELVAHGIRGNKKKPPYKRLVLLANIWLDHSPLGLEPLPEFVLEKLKLRAGEAQQPIPFAFPKGDTSPMKLRVHPMAPQRGWSFHSPWAEGEIWMPIAHELQRKEHADSIVMEFETSGGCTVTMLPNNHTCGNGEDRESDVKKRRKRRKKKKKKKRQN